MTAYERQLEQRVASLERMVSRIFSAQGLTDAELADYEMQDAIDEGVRTLNFKALQETLKKRIARRTA